eukprot:1034354-Prymnesium_polylepis.1
MPSAVNGTLVSVDHVVPQSWFVRSSQLWLNASPVEDAAQCVLVLRSENSGKSNKPVWLGQRGGADLTDNPDSALYRPGRHLFHGGAQGRAGE